MTTDMKLKARWDTQTVVPDFIVAGAAKCGTTYLLDALALHPEIAVSEPKETLYFSTQKPWGMHDKGPGYYARCFANRGHARLIGEASPHYFVDPASPGLIAAHAPDTKLIFLIRDPVKRAVSHYVHLLKGGHELPPLIDFVLSDDPRAANLRAHSDYLAGLSRFDAHFDPANMLILMQEDMLRDPVETLARVTDFLDLPPLASGADLDFSRNSAGLPRSPALQRLLFRNRTLRNLTKVLLPRVIFARARDLINRLQALNMGDARKVAFTAEEAGVLRARIMPDPEALEARLGRDLSSWRGAT